MAELINRFYKVKYIIYYVIVKKLRIKNWKLLCFIVPNLININIFKGQECEETLGGEKRKNEVDIGNDNKKLLVMNKVILFSFLPSHSIPK